MPSFVKYQDILPDPNNLYGNAGQPDSGNSGPGYASVDFRSIQPHSKHRTHSGAFTSVGIQAQHWELDIGYNPLTRDEFDTINSFLLTRRNGQIPFYVQMPQYLAAKDATFAAYVSGTTPDSENTAEIAGISDLLIRLESGAGSPSPGDTFNIDDPNDSTHTKLYKITKTETSTDYLVGNSITTEQRLIHFAPPLTKSWTAGRVNLIFHQPLMRVVLKSNSLEYTLGTDNLYRLSLTLEEV
jgi:hypothetical protein